NWKNRARKRFRRKQLYLLYQQQGRQRQCRCPCGPDAGCRTRNPTRAERFGILGLWCGSQGRPMGRKWPRRWPIWWWWWWWWISRWSRRLLAI
ncbi:hypothetical protein HDU91_002796, partial [Kappamyces sp. JEL0680]